MTRFVVLLFSILIGYSHASSFEDYNAPFTLIIRTPSATLGTDNIRPATTLPSCDEQRRLDNEGFEQIAALAATFSQQDQITSVFASEYCRSYQTATNVFPQRTVQIQASLNDACFHDAKINEVNQQRFLEMIMSAKESQAIVAHNCNIRMLFSSALSQACPGSNRLEAGQWMVVKAREDEVEILACPEPI